MVIRRAWLDFRIIYLPKRGYRLQNSPYFCVFKYTWAVKQTSSETQGQIVGARESLNGRKNKARRKEKNGEKSRSLLFFCAIFFRLFRLSLAPTICPWVSEDVKQNVWNEAENRERDWGETLKTLTPRFTYFFTDFEKKTDCLAV